MSDFVNEFWNWYVVLIVLVSIVACAVFLWSQSIHHPGGAETTDTTGHVWDETLEEYNNPLPKWWMWLFYLTAAAVTIAMRSESVLLLLVAGVVYMLIKAPPRPAVRAAGSLAVVGLGFWQFEWSTLGRIALFFTEAGTFVFGSGLAIVPFLHGGVVSQYQWLTEKEFLDAVAVAMITPGPVVITVGFIGYLVGGFPGASVAALATFLPCYLITVLLAPYFKAIARNKSIKAFVDGITAAVIGSLVGAVVVIGSGSITDIPTALIALASMLALTFAKKLQEPYIIGAAAVIGLLLKLPS